MASQFSFDAIGTKWVIDISQEISLERKGIILAKIKDRIDIFDRDYSRFRSDSWIMGLAREAGTFPLPGDAEPMFSLYRELEEMTGGLMTPLIGQTMVDAGYDAEYSFREKEFLAKPARWDEIIGYEFPNIAMKKPALLDVGAIGKGYLVDIVGKLLGEEGISDYCVDAGGDILRRTSKDETLRIGLEDPEDPKKTIGVVTVKNCGIAGSAGNRRKWGKFHHIINPETLSSPTEIAAIWAIADTAMLADAMTTALYFAPAEKLSERYRFDYLIMHTDRSVTGSLVGNPVLELF